LKGLHLSNEMRQTVSNRIGLLSNNIRSSSKEQHQEQPQRHITIATERDPLLPTSINTLDNNINKSGSSSSANNRGIASKESVKKNKQQQQQQQQQQQKRANNITQGTIRSRHVVGSLGHHGGVSGMGGKRSLSGEKSQSVDGDQNIQQALSEVTESTESYNLYNQQINSPLQSSGDSTSASGGGGKVRSPSWRLRERGGQGEGSSKSQHSVEGYNRQQYYNERANGLLGDNSAAEQPGYYAEVPEEIYAVRKAALTVLEPLTYTWIIFAIGFSLSAVLGISRWAMLLPKIPFWFVLLPAWLAHVGLLYSHISSAKALSTFIAEANENRQRQDSTDHLDRTEYLPLLQRSLKFGVKTGVLSLFFFIFEVMLYFRFIHGTLSLAATLTTIWMIVIYHILEGFVCKTQHAIRVLCWILLFTSMLLAVIKVDYQLDALRWRIVLSPVVALLSIASASLIYIIYGHQVGYFRLSESQLTAGILYSMATLICIVLVVVVGEMPLERPQVMETKLFVVFLSPMVVALVGVGAWAVTKDEFDRLLLFGGQPAVYPMKLRLEPQGWTSVESKGIMTIPMFGEISYEPLNSDNSDAIELCACCACYPYEEEEDTIQYNNERNPNFHPFLSAPSRESSR